VVKRWTVYAKSRSPPPYSPAVSHRHQEQCAISILGLASKEAWERLLPPCSYSTPILLLAEVPSSTPRSGARSAALPDPTCVAEKYEV
jgi:hypothetical protein